MYCMNHQRRLNLLQEPQLMAPGLDLDPSLLTHEELIFRHAEAACRPKACQTGVGSSESAQPSPAEMAKARFTPIETRTL